MACDKKVRLDRLFGNLGYCSREDVKSLLARDVITHVEGKKIRFDDKVLNAEILFNREPLDPDRMLILMHKPAGYECSHTAGAGSIYSLLPSRFRNRKPILSTVGRLDKDTTGVLLITDDGDFLHRLISPKMHVCKVYRVKLEKSLSGKEEELFTSGTIMLSGETKPLLPAKFEKISDTECILILHEGRYHQVKRMFEAIDNVVVQLHREAFGEWTLNHLGRELKVGEYSVTKL